MPRQEDPRASETVFEYPGYPARTDNLKTDRSALDRIWAVVVAFNPDDGFLARLERVQAQIDNIVIVDNGSRNARVIEHAAQASRGSVELLRNPANLGIAKALNQGLEVAIARGAEWGLTLDQDSLPAPDMVRELMSSQRSLPDADKVAVVAPQVIDTQFGRPSLFLRKRGRWLYRRVVCEDGLLDDVTAVISSGSLVKLSLFRSLGGFREDFFIDYVDTEYCLRAQANGFRIAVACGAHLEHKLGDRRQASIAGVQMVPTFHSPPRWYYISRNRIAMLRMYGSLFPHWLSYEVVAGTYGLLRMLLFEDRRLEKMRAVVWGTLDGLRGRMGRGPYHSELALRANQR